MGHLRQFQRPASSEMIERPSECINVVLVDLILVVTSASTSVAELTRGSCQMKRLENAPAHLASA